MGFPLDQLSADEEIVLDLRPHWWAIAPPTAGLSVAIIAGIIAVIAVENQDWLKILIGVVVLGCLAWFALRYAQWNTTNFTVTNERVISRTGVVSKQGVEIPLDRINTVFFNQGLFERIIGAGDLAIESASESGVQRFTDVRKPHMVQQEIYRMVEGFEQRRVDRIGRAVGQNAAPATAAAELSVPEQIAKLDELRRQGVLTDEEFQAKKTDLLGRM